PIGIGYPPATLSRQSLSKSIDLCPPTAMELLNTDLSKLLTSLGLDDNTPPSETEWRQLLERLSVILDAQAVDMVELRDSDEALRQLYDAIASKEDQLRAVIEAQSDGLVHVDADWNVVLVNPAAVRLMGWDSAVLGQPLAEVFEVLSETGERL